MPAYSGGTVWLQVVPSFNGLQGAIRKGVSGALAGAGIDKAAAKAFSDVDKQASAAGEKAARKMLGSFEKETTDRVKRMSKDFSVLREETGLIGKEFEQIQAVLKSIGKENLSTITGQGQARDDIVAVRNQIQGILDDVRAGRRQMSDPAQWGLGAIRKQADEIGEKISSWTAPDPKAVKQQEALQRAGNLRLRAEREMAAERTKAAANEGRALREQFRLEQNRDRLRRDTAKAESAATATRLRLAKTLADFTDRVSKGDRDAVAFQLRAAKTLSDFTERQARDRAKAQADEQRMGQLIARAQRENEERAARARVVEQAQIAQRLRAEREMTAEFAKREAAAKRAQAAEQKAGQLQARAERENIEFDVKINRERLEAEKRAIRNELRDLELDVQLGMDTTEAMAKHAALVARLKALNEEKFEAKVDIDTSDLDRQMRRVDNKMRSVGRGNSFMALLDAGSAANSVRVFNGLLFTMLSIGPLLIPLLAAISAGILGIGAAATGAMLGLGVLVAGLAGIGGAVSAMSELDRAKREQRSGGGAARDAAEARQRAVQDARSVADAQRALSRARQDGARAVADANRQVVDAEENLSRAHADAARSAEDAAERVRDARRAVVEANEAAAEAAEDAAERTADARQALLRAEEQATRAAQDSARRVRDAQERLTDAQEAARDAQLGLNEARQQAVRDLQDLNNALDSSQLRERDLAFQVEEASVHLNVVLEDDQATQRERDKAQLAYDQAVEALEQQRLETKRLETDTAKANKAGVEGSDRVKDAKERISDANQRVQDAEESLADARAARDRQAIDSARALADAREAVTDAVENEAEVAEESAQRIAEAREAVTDAVEAQALAAVDAAQRIQDAEEGLADARRGRADAQIQATQSISDAERGLARAHEDISLRATAAATATDSLATAQDNLAEALRGLSPAGVAFATWLYSLAPLLQDIRFAAQEGLLPGLQEGLSAIVDEYGPSFVAFVGEMATVLGDLASEFGNMLVDNPIWRDYFGMLADFGPQFLRQFGDVSINLLTAFASILTAFAPFVAEMGEGLVTLTEDFRNWAAGLEGSTALQGFFDYLREATPLISELVGNLFEILTDLFIGLAPYAGDLLDALIGMTDWLAGMDPDQIANLALLIGGVVLAFQLLAGAMALITGPLGLIGGAITFGRGVAGAVGGAAAKGGGRAAIGAAPATTAALGGVSGAAQGVGKKMIGLLGPVGLAISILWLIYDAAVFLDERFGIFGGHVEDFGDKVGAVFTWWWEEIIMPVWNLISGVLDVMGQAFRKVGGMIDQVFRFIIAPAFKWLWDNTIGPWWSEHVQPMLTKFGNFMKENLPTAIRTGANMIKAIWENILNIFRAPIKAAIDIVFNKGIIGSFNWLADQVPGMTPIDPINIPASLYPNGKKFADGGFMPGYTPGRDVHRFVSPTAGLLELSGGEPILRPEAGKVLGSDWVHGINSAARGGGTAGVQRFLGGGRQAYADGGIFGDLWDKVTGVGDALIDPLGWFEKITDKALSSLGLTGMLGDAVSGVALSVPKAIGSWIGSLLGAGQDVDGGGKPISTNAMGWQNQWNIVKAAFPTAALHSALRPGAITAVGTPSYHGLGRAIDITPSMQIFNWLARTFPLSTELIYSPAGANQLYKGQKTFFGEPTRGDHWDHIHWAMANGGILPSLYDNGGDVPPGLSLVANKTGKVESTVTNRFMEEVRSLAGRGSDAPVVDARGSTFGAMPREIVDEWNKQRRDNMALAGILDEPGVF